ncbi:hypothetical protein SAMN04489718_2133 [Actinopolyspora saharensis]|uniref:Uncharacterized protein n=1 Tax=Actinopolyspora saharensis TaxID=995062 RepID=A0A1H1DM50_9ACTN|nr:hypothetical protein SAMN04489718_2133 [Actinopolyspora saharensis]
MVSRIDGVYDYPSMPESRDALSMTRSFREAFLLSGPLAGGVGLLLRTLWLFPVALLIVVPFTALSWFASCRFGMCGRIGIADGLLRVDQNTWVDAWTRVLRAVLVTPADIAVTAVTVAALAWVCAGYRPTPRHVWRLFTKRGAGLCVLGLVLTTAPAVFTAVPLYFAQRQAVPVLAGEESPPLWRLLLLVALLLCVLLGGFTGIVSGVVANVAVVPFAVQRTGVREAVGRVGRMVLRRLLPTVGTVSLVLLLPALLEPLTTAVATASTETGSWSGNVVRDSLSSAVSLPFAAALYLTRYLDLSLHTDGYDAERLAVDLRTIGDLREERAQDAAAVEDAGARQRSDQPDRGVRG